MWRPYAAQLAPAGIASALDIGLSNWSFEFITVSLYVQLFIYLDYSETAI